MNKDKALDLALEALESCTPEDTSTGHVVWPSYDEQAVEQAITAIKQTRSAPYVALPRVQSCYCPNCEAMGKELAALKAQPASVQDVAFKQFLSDVLTAAGLVTHGKQCKALGERLGEGVMRYMTTPPAAPVQSCYCPNCEALSKELAALKAQTEPVHEPVAIDGNTSDGYHTFNELYEFRKAYNAALFNEWAAGGKCSVHKSWRHHDNELCFGGGWFIVVAVLPQGQISNHYEAKDWDLFAVPEVERVLFEFDGHTGADVVERLKTYTTQPAAQPAPVHEPVAWMKEGWGPDCGPYIEFYRDDEMGWRDRKEWTPLYTTQPAAQRTWAGLTDEEYGAMYNTHLRNGGPIQHFARAIEAKLKEKNT
jgi:hypothetical protein